MIILILYVFYDALLSTNKCLTLSLLFSHTTTLIIHTFCQTALLVTDITPHSDINFKMRITKSSRERLCLNILNFLNILSPGHPRFFNQLSCGLDVTSLAGEWLTATANTNMFTYEVTNQK